MGGVSEEALAEQFAKVDIWTPKLKFVDFAKFCVEQRWSKMELELELYSDDEEVLVEEGRATLCKAADITASSERRREALELKESRKKVMEMFSEWDSDRSGKISQEELSTVLAALNPKITPEICSSMFR